MTFLEPPAAFRHVLLVWSEASAPTTTCGTAAHPPLWSGNRCDNCGIALSSTGTPRRRLCSIHQSVAEEYGAQDARLVYLALLRCSDPFCIRGLLPLELLLRYVFAADDLLRSVPESPSDYPFYSSGRVLAGPERFAVWSELRYRSIQSIMAGVCKGGQAMGRYGSNSRCSGGLDSLCGRPLGMLDMLPAHQRREERRAQEMVLDDGPGYGGDIRR